MEPLAAKQDRSQAFNFPPGKKPCKFCTSADLFLDQRGMHFGYFCRQCSRWQGKWIKHSEVKKLRKSGFRYGTIPTPQHIQPKFDASDGFEPKPYPETRESIGRPAVDVPSGDLAVRVERLERAFAGYESQLGILVRAVLSAGVLQPPKSAPESDIDPERVYGLAESLACEEQGR
jgi:hypothetical protein